MGNAGKSAEECMASLCEFELGYGHVAVQVVSRDNPAKFKEQYEVHIPGLGSLGQFEELLSLQQIEILRSTLGVLLMSTKDKPFQAKQFIFHRFQPKTRYESFNPGV